MYKYLNLYHYISLILKYADKYKKIVYINAVGVEGYDYKNRKCRRLKKALNRNAVKMITTRDDIKKLKLYVDNNKTYINRVADPACICSDIYNIKKNKKSNIIGLCVCRDNLFLDNGIDFNEQDLLILWKNIITELEKQGYNYMIYTNGHKSDNKFAEKLIKKYNIDIKKMIIPKNEEELIKHIANFKAIIATRLHSSIIAFSLDVPAIGLVWNYKLKFFGKFINYPERYLEVKDFNSKNIVKKLEKAINEGFTNTNKDYKYSCKIEIANFIDKYIK